MFGYVNIYKDELKIKDYNVYRAYYCGLCKTLGKNHNQLVRLSLNYDFTFLAVLLDSLSKKDTEFAMSGCIKKLGKRKIVSYAEGLDFAADMNVILAYYKLKDDISDNFSIKAMIGILPFLRRASKIKKKYPKLCKTISDSLMRLGFLEEGKCDVADKTAHEFAVIMQSMFRKKSEVLSEFGYALGRVIYIMDAYDDMEEDYRNGSYNPVILQYGFNGVVTEDLRLAMKNNLYMSLGHLTELYERLDIVKNKNILDNILYLGMRAKSDSIINKSKSRKEQNL